MAGEQEQQYNRRSSDKEIYKSLEHMIENEADKEIRAKLLVMLEFSNVLAELAIKINQINTKVDSNEESINNTKDKLDELIESHEEIKNQVIGGWKVASVLFVVVQALFVYFINDHLEVSKAALEKQAVIDQRVQKLEIQQDRSRVR